ncbi:MAG: hypothetical protein HY381_01715 [Candidatus Chisholmbacteria bacterium]|nr:hypothetical protein [Candidatus Chisholmbacteria bacterium]
MKVNLLPQKQRWYLRRQRLGRWLQVGSLWLAVVYGLLLTGGVSWRLILNRQLVEVEEEIGLVKQEIEALAARESFQVTVKSKLSQIVQVRERQMDLAHVVRAIGEVFPEGVEIGELMIKNFEAIEVTANTLGPVELAEVINRLERDEGAEFWKGVKLQSVTKSSGGEYTFTLSLVPKKEI